MPKKINVDLEQLEALAARGYNTTMCCDAIGINRTTAYKNSYIINTIKAGHTIAKQKVIDDLMARSESDQSSTASIFLAKQVKVFDTYYPTSSPQSPQDALKKISNIFVSVARNELSEDKGNSLIGYLEKYVKAYETTEIEKRISKLEEVLNEK